MNFHRTMVAMLVTLFFIVFGFIAIEWSINTRFEMTNEANNITDKKSTVDYIIIDDNQQ